MHPASPAILYHVRVLVQYTLQAQVLLATPQLFLKDTSCILVGIRPPLLPQGG